MGYYSIIIFFLIGCSDGVHTEHPQSSTKEIEIEKPPSLIRWSHEYVMSPEEGDWSYYDDHENFISKYFSVTYQKKRIIATTLIEVNCIDSIEGKIDVSNDTIFLKSEIRITDDRVCSGFHKFKFTISNPQDKRYKIISTK